MSWPSYGRVQRANETDRGDGASSGDNRGWPTIGQNEISRSGEKVLTKYLGGHVRARRSDPEWLHSQDPVQIDHSWQRINNSHFAKTIGPISVRSGSTIEFREEELLLLRSGYV